MPIDDDNNLIDQGFNSISAADALDSLTPPQYGEHQFDQLYCDIDTTGYMTPVGGPSGMNTPFQSRSRSVSSENLTSLNGVASSDVTANALQSRLNNLDVASANRNTRDRTLDRSQLSTSGDGQGDQGDDSGTSNPASRRTSDEDDGLAGWIVAPQHIEYSAEDLAKVPSYKTALQTQTRMPINDGLPSYQNALQNSISRTPSIQVPVQNHRDLLRRCS